MEYNARDNVQITSEMSTSRQSTLLNDLLKYAVNKSGSFFETQCLMKFLKTNISQGSVATCFKCGGIFNGNLTANLLLILAVQKF